MKADLHMHTTYSDGRLDPMAVVDLAHANNVDIIAITDHDVVGDITPLIEYGKTIGVTVLPAIELSTLEDQKSVHVLGYFTEDNFHSEELVAYYRDIKIQREERAKRILKKLKEYHDIDITYDQVYQNAKGIIARPHIAKAISDTYPQYQHDYIFQEFIGDHCKAYEPSVELPVQEGIDLLRRHHCVVVLAHPTLLKSHIKEKVLAYPFDGYEARYLLNKPGEEEYFTSLATEKGLLITAGSDFHGIANDTKHGTIGQVYLDGEALARFLAQLEK